MRAITVRVAGRCATAGLVATLLTISVGGQSARISTSSHDDDLAAAGEWLDGAAVPFDFIDPNEKLDDLEQLRQIVGDARIVSLGEATHGTREFFQMKHRILRFLVERMGFTAFAIEANWPEANRLNRYVRTGEGDPAVLLTGLYFWTWNTAEVLQMIRWMRSYNAAGGNVGFYGFDMQAPGMAIDNVMRFVRSVDPDAAGAFTQHLACIVPYANDWLGRFTLDYTSRSAAYRDACYQDLRWVEDTVIARRDAYETQSSTTEWARGAQSARVVVQFEEMASSRRDRDLAMADNAKWLLDQLPPGGKIVLWAHNQHVSTGASFRMGGALRQMVGADMVTMGFSFAEGAFNAVDPSTHSVVPHAVMRPKPDSYEEYFRAGGMPRFFLDLRNRSAVSGSPAWLFGPRDAFSVGAAFNDDLALSYYSRTSLPADFDVVIFFDHTSPSVLLPRTYPTSF